MSEYNLESMVWAIQALAPRALRPITAANESIRLRIVVHLLNGTVATGGNVILVRTKAEMT
jgi:hypothetical protein